MEDILEDKSNYVIETKDALEDKDLITQDFLGLNKIVGNPNSSPGSLLFFSTLQIVLVVFPNSKLNLILRFTLKQSMKKQLNMLIYLKIVADFHYSNFGSPSIYPKVEVIFHLKPLQPWNLATLQPCNLETLQPCNLTTLQPYNLAILQGWNFASLKACNLETLQACNRLTILLTYKPTNLLTYWPTDLLTYWLTDQPWIPGWIPSEYATYLLCST